MRSPTNTSPSSPSCRRTPSGPSWLPARPSDLGAEEVLERARLLELPARIVGRDPASDLALLKIEGRNLPYVNWGDSTKARVGDWVGTDEPIVKEAVEHRGDGGAHGS